MTGQLAVADVVDVVIDIVILMVIVVIDIVIVHQCKAQRVDRSVGGAAWSIGGRQKLLALAPACSGSQSTPATLNTVALRPLSTVALKPISTVALNRGWRQDICRDPR